MTSARPATDTSHLSKIAGTPLSVVNVRLLWRLRGSTDRANLVMNSAPVSSGAENLPVRQSYGQ